MSYTVNMEECVNGIRACVVLPGEVATPILDKRPVPVTKPAEGKRRWRSPRTSATSSATSPRLPPHVVINEVWINPTWNRGYVANLNRAKA